VSQAPELTASDDEMSTLRASGARTLANAEILEGLCAHMAARQVGTIDLSGVTALDTVGAWLFEKLARRFSTPASKLAFVAVPAAYAGLIQELDGVNRRTPAARPRGNAVLDVLERIGRSLATESASFLQMLGACRARGAAPGRYRLVRQRGVQCKPARTIASAVAPTRMRLTAQIVSRLNQLRDTNLSPR
jgi:phospholipid/cholesterol/gamma-HCH transport system permease protein